MYWFAFQQVRWMMLVRTEVGRDCLFSDVVADEHDTSTEQ